jgi:hypothetical protein
MLTCTGWTINTFVFQGFLCIYVSSYPAICILSVHQSICLSTKPSSSNLPNPNYLSVSSYDWLSLCLSISLGIHLLRVFSAPFCHQGVGCGEVSVSPGQAEPQPLHFAVLALLSLPPASRQLPAELPSQRASDPSRRAWLPPPAGFLRAKCSHCTAHEQHLALST